MAEAQQRTTIVTTVIRSLCCCSTSFLTRAIFCLLGIGVLIPWNAFVSAAPYFFHRTCRKDAELWFGLVYNLSSVATLVYAIARTTTTATTTATANSSTITTSYYNTHPIAQAYYMVMIPLSIYLAIFIFTIILIFIPIPKTYFFIITLVSLGICGAVGAIANAGLTVTASSTFLFHDHQCNNNLGPLLAGYAVGGVVMSITNFLSAVGESPNWEQICPNNKNLTNVQQYPIMVDAAQGTDNCFADTDGQTIDWAVVSYFGMSCLVLLACLMGFQWLHFSSRRSYEPLAEVPDTAAAAAEPIASFDSSPRFPTELALEVDVADDEEDETDGYNSTSTVWVKIRQPALTIFLTFVVTLAIFPAWTSTLQSAHRCETHNRFQNDLFTPLTFLWFNVGDLMGRVLAERYSSYLTADQLVPYALSRCILFLLFAMLPSSLRTTSMTKTITPIPSDFFTFVVLATLALSNGFLISWSFMVAPSCISKHADEQIKSSEVLNLSLSSGLLAGSMLSFVYLNAVV